MRFLSLMLILALGGLATLRFSIAQGPDVKKPATPLMVPKVIPSPPPPPAKDEFDKLLGKLREPLELDDDLYDMSFGDFLKRLEAKHDLRVIVNQQSFKNGGEMAILETKITLKQKLTGLPVRTVLELVASEFSGVCRVRNSYVELVSNVDEAPELAAQIVSFNFKAKPFAEAVAEVVAESDRTVVLSPQIGEARTAPVTARLMNVPFETALESLAMQVELIVVQRGTVAWIVTREQANTISADDSNRAQQMAELRDLANPPAALNGLGICGGAAIGNLGGAGGGPAHNGNAGGLGGAGKRG